MLNQLPESPPHSILSSTIYQDEQLKAMFFGFAAEQELSEHTASSPAVLHLLRGEAAVKLNNDSIEITEGGWIHMPAQLPHNILARTPAVLLFLLKHAPGNTR